MSRPAREIIRSGIDVNYFESRVDKGNECWNWIGSVYGDTGYGYYTVKQKRFLAHRISFCLHYGEISKDLVIDHICRNRRCVNPEHLREVTQGVNAIENNNSPVKINKYKTHCPQGHEYAGENLKFGYTPKRKLFRVCRICFNASRMRSYYKRQARKKI